MGLSEPIGLLTHWKESKALCDAMVDPVKEGGKMSFTGSDGWNSNCFRRGWKRIGFKQCDIRLSAKREYAEELQKSGRV